MTVGALGRDSERLVVVEDSFQVDSDSLLLQLIRMSSFWEKMVECDGGKRKSWRSAADSMPVESGGSRREGESFRMVKREEYGENWVRYSHSMMYSGGEGRLRTAKFHVWDGVM